MLGIAEALLASSDANIQKVVLLSRADARKVRRRLVCLRQCCMGKREVGRVIHTKHEELGGACLGNWWEFRIFCCYHVCFGEKEIAQTHISRNPGIIPENQTVGYLFGVCLHRVFLSPYTDQKEMDAQALMLAPKPAQVAKTQAFSPLG